MRGGRYKGPAQHLCGGIALSSPGDAPASLPATTSLNTCAILLGASSLTSSAVRRWRFHVPVHKISYRGFPYLSIYPKKKHAPKPQIRMIIRAPKQQIRMIIRVLDDSSIIRIICGPELKTRRNRNFPHIQRSFPRTFRCVSSEKSAPKSPFCVWLSSAFRWFLSGRKSRNPIDNTCPKMRNPIV